MGPTGEMPTAEMLAAAGQRQRLPIAVRAPLVAASLVVVAAGLRAGASILAPFMLAAFITVVSMPALVWLRRNGAPLPVAIVLIVLLDAVVIAVVGWIVLQSAAELRIVAPTYLARIQEIEALGIARLQALGYEVSALEYREIVNPERMFALATGVALRLTGIIGVVLLILLYLVFMLAESAGLPAKLNRAFGHRFGEVSRLGQVVREIQHYLALKTLVSLATGIIVGMAAAFIGVDFALFWGFLAFALNYVPSLGSILAAIPAILVAMLQLGPGPAASLAAVYLAVNIVLGSILDPILVGRRLGLSTLVVLLSLVFWGWAWGVIGMFLAVPLTASAKIAMENSPSLHPIAVLLGPVPAPIGLAGRRAMKAGASPPG